jgi:tRNA-specific 2-thiouridylase
MKNWEEDDTETHCAAAQDLSDARQICDLLSIPLHVVNFSKLYWEHVFTHFLEEYRNGRTPNPDILCNREIKFKAFLNYSIQQGADYMATGHYAQTNHRPEGHELKKGYDGSKDQSYFLYALDQKALAHALFPIGHLTKTQVRALATQAQFPNAHKKDSTGICFIGERRFRTFLEQYLPAQPGPIITTEHTPIGTHQGLMFYTLGQRHGLHIGGQSQGREAPWYVVDKDLVHNHLIVAQGHDHPRLFRDTLIAEQVHWITRKEPPQTLRCHAKIRYRQTDQPCSLHLISNNPLHYQVTFNHPQRAIAPGQSVVFYEGDICLGGGIIQ